MTTKDIGEISTGMVMAVFIKKQIPVLLPFGDNQRYDLGIDIYGKIQKVQCKTGRLRDGAICFNTCSVGLRSRKREHYRGQADYFGIYCPDNDKVYFVPVKDVPLTTGTLRIDKTKNNQKKSIIFAKKYEI